jgi:hypothetical protein
MHGGFFATLGVLKTTSFLESSSQPPCSWEICWLTPRLVKSVLVFVSWHSICR